MSNPIGPMTFLIEMSDSSSFDRESYVAMLNSSELATRSQAQFSLGWYSIKGYRADLILLPYGLSPSSTMYDFERFSAGVLKSQFLLFIRREQLDLLLLRICDG